MRGKKTEKKGKEDVERTNQATCEGPSKRKQKQSKVNRTDKDTKLFIMNWNCHINVHVNQTIKGDVYWFPKYVFTSTYLQVLLVKQYWTTVVFQVNSCYPVCVTLAQ